MPNSKIKNLCLVILLLCNICLLCLLLPIRLEASRVSQRTTAQLRQLYDNYNISLPDETLPEGRALYTLEAQLDANAALTAARALLGSDVTAEEDSGSYQAVYTSELGSCSIRRSQLDAQLLDVPLSGTPRAAVKKLLKKMELSCDEITQVQAESDVSRFQTRQTILGVSVFSAELSFDCKNGQLTGVSGTFCPIGDTLTAVGRDTCISCADALAAFLDERTTIGWVGSSILSIEQGYLIAEGASAATLRLLPVWRLETDTAVLYINGITREVISL